MAKKRYGEIGGGFLNGSAHVKSATRRIERAKAGDTEAKTTEAELKSLWSDLGKTNDVGRLALYAMTAHSVDDLRERAQLDPDREPLAQILNALAHRTGTHQVALVVRKDGSYSFLALGEPQAMECLRTKCTDAACPEGSSQSRSASTPDDTQCTCCPPRQKEMTGGKWISQIGATAKGLNEGQTAYFFVQEGEGLRLAISSAKAKRR